jgi:hypothetical protein
MKKISIIMFAVVSMALVTFSSCGKYEEGPGFSLRSKTARVSNTWDLEKIAFIGADGSKIEATITDPEDKQTLEINKDGSWESRDYTGAIIDKGTWKFSSKNEQLDLKSTLYSEVQSNKILRLANNELWLEYPDPDDPGDKYIFYWKTK